LNLDVRDFGFWFLAAQRKTLNEKIDALRMSRMAWAEGDTVKSEMALYQNALANLDAMERGVLATPKVTTWLDITGGRRIGRA